MRRHPGRIRLGSEGDTTPSLTTAAQMGARAAWAADAGSTPGGLRARFHFTNEETATRRGETLASAHTARWVELGSGSGYGSQSPPTGQSIKSGETSGGMQRGNGSISAGPQREEKTFSA